MALFDQLADLPLEVESYELEGLERDVSSDFTRLTTVIHLHGGGEEGVGEDVVYDALDHIALQETGPVHDLTGPRTLGEFCDLIHSLDLFPAPPVREVSPLYRRWAFESAALDLALRQAGTSLHEHLGIAPQPVTFVVSLRLGDPPTIEPVRRRLDSYPTLRFKLDPVSAWTEELIAELVATGAVDSVDLKGLYKGSVVDQGADPVLYERVAKAFPSAWIEDPALTPETEPSWRRARSHHVGRPDPRDRRHRGAAVPAPDGEREAVARGRPARAVRDLRLLRRARHRHVRRRPVRARAGPRPHPVPRLAVPPRHAERRGAGGLQRPRTSGRAAGEPAAAHAQRDRLSLGCVRGAPMGFIDKLNEQIGHEFAASQQYVAIAVHYDAETLPRLAAVFYAQAVEERNHAMMLVQYLLDVGEEVRIPGVEAPKTSFGDIAEPVALALDQEKRVSEQISALAGAAREEGDYMGEQFMQWFIKEQVEEVSSMSDLLAVVERSRENPMIVEEYIVRERPMGEAADPTAPAAAGGAL